ncbi:DUF6049 family protein [Cellulomonas sp. URHD0024]|uniref:DUF6049 family protein n=1 Tax=Cellulomonas sp. URHD0024 TaxID=1302620 RepID=UPI0004055267|nr:DUF6049 family protein [Cellulomonas sp. URHD0024]
MSARTTLRRVLCVALALGAALPAGTPAQAADEDTYPVAVHVDEISPVVVRPGDPLTVRATVTNTSTEVIDEPVATVRLSRFTVSTRDDLEAWVSSTTCASNRPCPQVTSVALPGPLAPGQSAPVELNVPAKDLRLKNLPDTWGPRGISVEVTAGRRRVGLERTFLLWLTDDAKLERTPVSVLVPVVGPGADPLNPDQNALDRLVAHGGRLDDLATTLAANPRIGVAVDPALLAQAATGSTRAQAWGSALDADLVHHDVLTLPWSDPDVGAAGHAGQSGLVKLAVDASAATDASGPGVLWTPSGGATDQTTLGVTAQVGEPAVVVAPGAVDVDRPKNGRTPQARTAVRTPAGTVHALVPDSRLSALMTDPTSVDPQATPATTVQRALSELAVVTRETSSDQPRLLMTADRSWSPDGPSVAALLTALDDAPWVHLTDPSSLLGDTAAGKGSVPASAADPAELAPDTVRALAAARDRAIAFATVTDEPDRLLVGVDAEVVAPLAVAWRPVPGQRTDLVARVLADVSQRASGLSIAALSDLAVISSTGVIRMTVFNDLTVPVTVHLTVQPRKPCLAAEDVPPVSVAAKRNTVVPVTLNARANCEVTVVARLTSADGTPVSEPVSFVARVAPTIESVGTKIVGGLLAIGLILGIARTIRRGQSSRRGSRVDVEDPARTPQPGETGVETQEPVPSEPDS